MGGGWGVDGGFIWGEEIKIDLPVILWVGGGWMGVDGGINMGN